MDRAIDVLMALREDASAQSDSGELRGGTGWASSAGVSEVAARVGLPKSTAHRLLQSLAARGLVEAEGDGTYRLGFALLPLAASVQEADPFLRLGRVVLEEVTQETDESSFLVAHRGSLRVLAKVEGEAFLRTVPEVGSEIPWHATASGRLHLAFAPSVARNVELSADTMTRYTPRTPRSVRSLHRMVAEARRRGWDINRGEWTEGVTVVAAPVMVGERLYGTLAVAAPSVRASHAGETMLAKHVCNGADLLSARLSGAFR